MGIIAAVLSPDEIEERAGQIFPAEHDRAAQDAVIGKRLDLFLDSRAGLVNRGEFSGGQGVDESDVPTAQLSGEFGRAEDGRPVCV